MNVSVFDLFKPGVGPSSSHTMGPMTAAGRFLKLLGPALPMTRRVQVQLYASLALTGRGHATDTAVLLGLAGFDPATLAAHPEMIYPEDLADILAELTR